MSKENGILMRMFGRPRGFLARLGGPIMARTNRTAAAWVIGLLEIQPHDSAVEIGFGPGVAIQLLAEMAGRGIVAGVDSSREMVEQAIARNRQGIQRERIDLRHGSAESLPFDSDRFDKALAINSLQVWHDPLAGLREIRRVLKPGGRIALGFTPHSGQTSAGLPEMLAAAGFAEAHLVEAAPGFCALAARSHTEEA